MTHSPHKCDCRYGPGGIADPDELKHFVEKFQLKQHEVLRAFSELLSPAKAGIAEVVIRPGPQWACPHR